jgi:hypothetical protein
LPSFFLDAPVGLPEIQLLAHADAAGNTADVLQVFAFAGP